MRVDRCKRCGKDDLMYSDMFMCQSCRVRYEKIKEKLNNEECVILDAGCGTGNHAKILHDKGYSVFGFDLSPQMVEIANTKVNNNFEVANLLFYSTEKKFDLIISFYAVFKDNC